MHADFKYNFIRYHILAEALKGAVQLDDFKGDYFTKKEVKNVSTEEVADQLEHLRSEHFLMKKTDEDYEITEEGRLEIADVVRAIDQF